MEDKIEIANLKVGQKFTLELGDKEPIFTKMEEPKQFNIEDWFPDERVIYLLEDVIEEEKPLHYMLEAGHDLAAWEKANKGMFGVNRTGGDFLGHSVEGIELEDEE